MLEEEIYGENSPIWEADFTMPASDGAQLGHQTGVCWLLRWLLEMSNFVMYLLIQIHVKQWLKQFSYSAYLNKNI